MQRIIPIRASSLAELFDCPARWEAKNLLGMRMPSSGAARLGTAIHAGTAAFDQAKLDGTPITPDDAAGELIKALYDTEEEVDWEDAQPRDAERIGLALHTRYCAQIAPQQDYVAVELTCDRMEISDLGIALTGTTDRVRRTDSGELGIADLKSGARAVGSDGTVATAGHGPQMGVYEILAQHALGEPITAPAQIVGLQTGKTAAAQRVGTGEISGARDALVGTDDSPGLLQHASRLVHSGSFYGNPKSVLCSGKYCPRHPICKFKG
ncbi:RecB family exonuclease [Achromobacter denitrificans]|uniref:RecB family exonuclease n=1 Tax=Achromobacter denitrificans TaxID=32002 RepID=UPI000F67B840|nr:PD-(D/E)XK nuclease family protein [Achromobacter denitrificans]RSE88624.1 PD-(D/E)XK nuclease family protein [Achromobacter denitrificans]